MITVRLTEEIWEEARRGNRLLFPEDGPEIAELLKAGERVTISLDAVDWVLDKDGSSLFRSGTYDRLFTDWLRKFFPEAFL